MRLWNYNISFAPEKAKNNEISYLAAANPGNLRDLSQLFYKIIWFLLTSIALPSIILTYAQLNLGLSNKTTLVGYASYFLIIAINAYQLTNTLSKGVTSVTVFWLFSYIFMGISPLVQYSTGIFPWGGTYSENLIVKANFVVIIGYLAYIYGRKIAKPFRRRKIKVFSLRRLYLFSVVSCFLSLYIAFFLIGVENVFSTRVGLSVEVFSRYDKSVALLLTSGMRNPPFVFFLIFVAMKLFKGKLYVTKYPIIENVIVFPLLVVTNIIVNNPFSQSRFGTGVIFLCLIILITSKLKFKTSIWFVPPILAAFLFLFPIADIFRHNTLDDILSGHANISFVNPVVALAHDGDYDAYQQLLNTIVLVEREGTTLGRQLLGTILFWFPRFFWPDKPIGSGQFVAEFARYRWTNLSNPLWGEGYINFGMLGVATFFLFLGVLTKKLDLSYTDILKDFWNNPRKVVSLPVVVIFQPILASYMFFILRGDLMSSTSLLMSVLVPIISVSMDVKNKNKV